MPEALFGGVNAAVLTPMRDDLSPDPVRLAARCRWLLANGCDGIGLLGTTGEANSLGLDERRAVLEGVVAQGIDPARLLPGTATPALTDTVTLTRHAAAQGCRGVLLLPPFYYKGPSEDGLFAWFSEVINRTGGGTAIYLYHFPQQSAVPFTLPLVERLLRAFPGTVRGMKDSSGDWDNTAAMIANFAAEGFEVYSGADEHLQRNLAAGGAGCITATSNISAPWAQLVYAHRDGPEAAAAQARMVALRGVVAGPQLIPNLHEIVARSTGDAAWRTPRPPFLPLPAEAAGSLWARYQAALPEGWQASQATA
ncbi:dihydrodipicolinate synthase family protein [Roseomonas sp. NAR14]|uniref:Dihydrodipicolinate synthase family protein n=1 Tax=Roseomonas acroporae TaxID=2937791 RepID=A0A9X1Y826_9PROT|nr:dihydrodipicolinate synthase family protein [Roseomonas acroporae]MCK8783935.1 dihydrodipicolinate synthase family protein [Roseomonas acroporae]